MTLQFEAVLYRKYGGFHINTEMALWLMEHRAWKVVDEDCTPNKKASWPINQLANGFGDHYYHPNEDTMEFRTNKDLIDCVLALQELHKDDSYNEKYYSHIFALEVTKVSIECEVEDYNDGHERITCHVST